MVDFEMTKISLGLMFGYSCPKLGIFWLADADKLNLGNESENRVVSVKP